MSNTIKALDGGVYHQDPDKQGWTYEAPPPRINFGPGALFIRDENDELQPLGEVADCAIGVDLTESIERGPLSLSTTGEATFTIQLTLEAVVEFFLALLKDRGYIVRPFRGILRQAGHGRVAHLAIHAKRARTRRKNTRRALKILKKEASRSCR